jgi:hypothetical protein
MHACYKRVDFNATTFTKKRISRRVDISYSNIITQLVFYV